MRGHQLEWNCRIKTEYPLNDNCRKENVIYGSTALTTFQPKKVFLGNAEGEFKSKDIITTLNHFETRTVRTV